MTIYTVGHSNMTAGQFLSLLKVNHIEALWDIRSHPGSGAHPQFGRYQLGEMLRRKNIDYSWVGTLGGWAYEYRAYRDHMPIDIRPYLKPAFPKQHIAAAVEVSPDGGEPYWNNRGLYDYQWFMTLSEFEAGWITLERYAQKLNVAVMCAEALWWKCHRSMLADFLVFMGTDAIHIQPRRTAHSKAIGNRLQRYDRRVINTWLDWRDDWRRNGLGIRPRGVWTKADKDREKRMLTNRYLWERRG